MYQLVREWVFESFFDLEIERTIVCISESKVLLEQYCLDNNIVLNKVSENEEYKTSYTIEESEIKML